MEIWLVRHTRPAVEPGTCYGWTDVPLASSFAEEAALIRPFLPNLTSANQLWCSPLSRCTTLVSYVYADLLPTIHPDLREMHFGEWENRNWSTISEAESASWMADFVHLPTPGGESYIQLDERVWSCVFSLFESQQDVPRVIVSHGGVMRCLLARLLDVPLGESFRQFKLDYGAVIRLHRAEGSSWQADFMHQATWNRLGE